jgi:hypothetical protein
MYVQRYVQHFPAGGEVVILDRSWYNRAGVERVMGLLTGGDRSVPGTGASLGEGHDGFRDPAAEVLAGGQLRGADPPVQSRINDWRKIWKLSAMDLESYCRWYDYSRARDAMFASTDSVWAPWYVADANDKKRARLNIISHLLSQVPCKPLAHREVKLPRRQQPDGCAPPELPLRHIPTPF